MKIERLLLKDFTAFAEAELEFSPGLNVLIGANGTGKSHVLKVLYCILRPRVSAQADAQAGTLIRGLEGDRIWSKLFGVLRPLPASDRDSGKSVYGPIMRSLTRRGVTGLLRVEAHGDFGEVTLEAPDAIPFWRITDGQPRPGPVVFIPAAEVLSIYHGFVAAYERRELSFDETYRDLCVDLAAAPLRSVSPPGLEESAAKLDGAVGGKTELRGDRFYVSLSDNWLLEATMLAEGLRKVAAIAHLIRNGSIAEGSVLLWDEPETNMNPKLIPTVAQTLLSLARAGVQVFIATHDYLLTSEISIAAEYATEEAKLAAPRFFAFAKPGPLAPVVVESGDTLADLRHNPILEEFAAHYDRERNLFYGSEPAGTREPN